MPIKYDKLLQLLEKKGYTSYRIRKERIIGQATLTAIKNGTRRTGSSFYSKTL